jgi:diguanylate cyclase (GGDEF)-like protein
MAASMSRRFSQLGYERARRLLLVAGLLVLAVVALVTYVRRVDPVEVVATILFMPIFVAFVLKGVAGGLVAAVAAIAAYAALRSPAIDAVGIGQFTGLLTSRSAAYLIFGAVGGWSTQVLESALEKLDLYDEIDDDTGLYNARHLLAQTDLEVARARRYKTLFSVVTLDLPATPFDGLGRRKRRQVLRELGRQVGSSVRTVDHVVHFRDGDVHRLAAILPETGSEGAEVFRGRFADRVVAMLSERDVAVPQSATVSTCITVPGDDPALDALRADAGRVDAAEHRAPRPEHAPAG